MEKYNARHYPYIVDGKGRGMLDDVCGFELKEIGERNVVEGKFGNAKRKLGLSRIMAKLENTTKSMIAMDFFILNIERLLRQKSVLLYPFLLFSLLYKQMIRHKNIYWVSI